MKASEGSGAVSAYLRRNALALVALFFAISGGVAWATHPGGANTISSADIIAGAVRSTDIGTGQVATQDLAVDSVNAGRIADDAVRSSEVLDGSLGGADIAEGTFDEEVPAAAFARLAGHADLAESLEQDQIEVNTNSIVVPGGSQDDSNGNGISRPVIVFCDAAISGGDVAIGGGAYWSGNANSNSDELENRIHSLTYLDSTGDVATNGEIPRGIRVRGEVDKDGNDTLTAQVLCFPAF